MYHTEGFVNKYTMDFGKHIVMLSLEEGGCPWYVWCVVKKAVVDKEWLRQVLSFWLQQTLLTNGICEVKYAQRELNRLGGYLQNVDPVKVQMDDVQLFMYYRGAFYRWESDYVVKNRSVQGANLHREISEGMYGYVSEEGLWEQYEKQPFGEKVQAEELANHWETSLMEACSKGEVEEGFFFIWEDAVGLTKR